MAHEVGEGKTSTAAKSLIFARRLVTPSALDEVARASHYLMDFNPRAAAALAEGPLAAGDSLAHFPYRGRRVSNTGMRELITAYPYIIRYRVARNTVRILRVRHTSRRPTKR